MILDILIGGLISGSVYALLAIGFSLIFGVARIVNIAHTAFYMVAGYGIYFGTHKLGFHPLLCMLASVIMVTVFGLIAYKLFIDPIREHEAAVLICTIAMAMAMQEIMLLLFTGSYLSVPALIAGFFTLLGVKVFYQQLLTFGLVLLILAALWILLMKTRLGLAIRSTAQDREVANLMGINESRAALITMGITVGLAGLAGAVVVPLTILDPFIVDAPADHDDGRGGLGRIGQPQRKFYRSLHPGFCRSAGGFPDSQGGFPQGIGGFVRYDPGAAHPARRPFRRRL